MIIEQYVSFETARMLREVGFQELCFSLSTPAAGRYGN